VTRRPSMTAPRRIAHPRMIPQEYQLTTSSNVFQLRVHDPAADWEQRAGEAEG
jgi:hypothetical protein